MGALFSAPMVIWGTLLQRRVPPALLGRVASLDFFVSVSLMPVSMALAGPVSEAIGLRTTFAVAGIVPVVVAVVAIVWARLPQDELRPPPARLTRMAVRIHNITFDCADARALAGFWSALTGWNVYYDDDPEVVLAPSLPLRRHGHAVHPGAGGQDRQEPAPPRPVPGARHPRRDGRDGRGRRGDRRRRPPQGTTARAG